MIPSERQVSWALLGVSWGIRGRILWALDGCEGTMGTIGVVFGWSETLLQRILRKSFALACIWGPWGGGDGVSDGTFRRFLVESIGVLDTPLTPP